MGINPQNREAWDLQTYAGDILASARRLNTQIHDRAATLPPRVKKQLLAHLNGLHGDSVEILQVTFPEITEADTILSAEE